MFRVLNLHISRYDHFSVLCELLPSAIPSLAINLLATSNGYFNQSLRTKLNAGLSCGVFGPPADRGMFLNLNNDPFLWDQFARCAFPGHAFFKLLYRLNSLEREVNEYVTSVGKICLFFNIYTFILRLLLFVKVVYKYIYISKFFINWFAADRYLFLFHSPFHMCLMACALTGFEEYIAA